MANIAQYFMAHARQAAFKARRMPCGTAARRKQRVVARVCRLLAREADREQKVALLDDFRATRHSGRATGG